MNTAVVEKRFNEIGARVKFGVPRQFRENDFSIDVRRDSEGEFFDVHVKKEIEMMVLDAQKKDRHLLLLVKQPDNPQGRYLCGHDERSWFTCAIPEKAGASTVFQAKQALKPRDVRDLERNEGVKSAKAHKRRKKLNSGRKEFRQGEFFFIEQPGFTPPQGFPSVIHKNEPMSRGRGSKPHIAEFLYRRGGETVYVSSYSLGAQNGLTEKDYNAILKKDPKAKNYNWRIMTANADVFVKGKITHSDHSTLNLGDIWYRVLINSEGEARANKNVKFLD